MAGGKGGSQTSSVEIPEYIEAAAQRNLNKAERISQLGYVPYYGPDVAAFTPMQQAAMQNVAGAAGAFGMATPQGQDIYGMPAPTEYAGGIQGYSSAPMFEQAQAELAARRPAQKSYIDSFFIDPSSGNYAFQPFDYTTINTMAEDRRQREAADRAYDLAIAQAQARPQTSYGTTPVSAQDEGVFGTGDYYGAFSENYEAALADAEQNPTGMTEGIPIYDQGYVGISDPATNLVGGALNRSGVGLIGSAITGEPMIPDVSSLIAPTVDLSDYNPTPTIMPEPLATGGTRDDVGGGSSAPVMVTAREDNFASDLTRSLTDPNYDPPGNVITRALGITKTSDNDNDGSDDSGGGDDGTVMCTAYCEMGYLPKEIWHLDRRYGVKVYRNDPALIEGYHTWGVPLANYIRKQTLGAKVLRAVMWPIVKAWAEEMAHNMKPEEYKPNYFGKLIKFVGEPFSRMCGKLKPRKVEGVA